MNAKRRGVEILAGRMSGGLALALLLFFARASMAIAGSGEVVSTPGPKVRNTSGLRLTVDTQWIDASGYRDVRLHLATASGGPSPSERTLEVSLSPNAYGRAEFTVRKAITLEQGATQATVHMYVPQNQPWHQVSTSVTEGGSYWKELSASSTGTNSGEEWTEVVPSFLIIDSKAPNSIDRADHLRRFNFSEYGEAKFFNSKDLVDVRGAEALVKRGVFYPGAEGDRPHDAEMLRRVASTGRLELLPPASLPDNWIGLSAIDIIVVSLADLQSMAQQHKPQFAALTAWVTAGGNLIVYGMGNNYERLAEFESLLKFSPTTAGGDFTAAGWESGKARDFNDNTTRTFQEMQNYGGYGYYETAEETTVEPQPANIGYDAAFGAGTQDKFLARETGMGLVVAMATANPFPGSSTEWSWLLNTINSRRYMWYLRNGLSLRRQNDDYWDLLVPNTGMAPVWEFCILITMFALVIGPINYFVLLRKKRLYLLLVTIPVGAAIVTMALFFYAVLSDGLGTRTRIRSYTHLDQTAGRAASWSRQSYYAGLAPSRGLTFAGDAAVYVSEQKPRNEYAGGFQRQRTLLWNDDGEQNLRAGYMSSRVTSQFLVMRAAETAAAVRLDKNIAPSKAQNGLGGDIVQIMVRDKAGEYFWAEEAAAGGQFTLAPAKFDDCLAKLKKQFADHRPAQPVGLDPSQFDNWGYWYGGWGIDNSQPPPRTSSSLMEQELRRLQNAKNDTLAPGSYVAIMRTSAETPLGVAGAREEGSFHVIEGKF